MPPPRWRKPSWGRRAKTRWTRRAQSRTLASAATRWTRRATETTVPSNLGVPPRLGDKADQPVCFPHRKQEGRPVPNAMGQVDGSTTFGRALFEM